MVTKKLHLTDSHEALLLFGKHDQNLRALESTYGVQIFGRAHVLSVRGAPGKVEKALLAIEDMRENLGRENHQPGKGPDPIPDKASDPFSAEPAAYTSALGKSIRAKTA